MSNISNENINLMDLAHQSTHSFINDSSSQISEIEDNSSTNVSDGIYIAGSTQKNMFSNAGTDRLKLSYQQRMSSLAATPLSTLSTTNANNTSNISGELRNSSFQNTTTSQAAQQGPDVSFDSMSISNTTSFAGSSKAVLAALKALQEKIKRLENDKASMTEEAKVVQQTHKDAMKRLETAKDIEITNNKSLIDELEKSYEDLTKLKQSLDVNYARLDERNVELQKEISHLHEKIGDGEDRLRECNARIVELNTQLSEKEQLLSRRDEKEKEVNQTIVWESKRHEEEKNDLMTRMRTLQSELTRTKYEKEVSANRQLELDSMVKQLLSVNATLVSEAAQKNEYDKHHHHYSRHHHAKHNPTEEKTKKHKKKKHKEHTHHKVTTDYDSATGHHHDHAHGPALHRAHTHHNISSSSSKPRSRANSIDSARSHLSETSVVSIKNNKKTKSIISKSNATSNSKSSKPIVSNVASRVKTSKSTSMTTSRSKVGANVSTGKATAMKSKISSTSKSTKKGSTKKKSNSRIRKGGKNDDESSVASYTSTGSYNSRTSQSTINSVGSYRNLRSQTRMKEQAHKGNEPDNSKSTISTGSTIHTSNGKALTVHLPSTGINNNEHGIAFNQSSPLPPLAPPMPGTLGGAEYKEDLNVSADSTQTLVDEEDAEFLKLTTAERMMLLTQSPSEYLDAPQDKTAQMAKYDTVLKETDSRLNDLNKSLELANSVNRDLAVGQGLVPANIMVNGDGNLMHNHHTSASNSNIPMPVGSHYGDVPEYSSTNNVLLNMGDHTGLKPLTSPSKDTLNSVIQSLELEFTALNNQYRKLLTTVQNDPDVESRNAEELVGIINQLHRKGEQLRKLRQGNGVLN